MKQVCVLDASVVVRWWYRESDFDLTDAARSILRRLAAGDLSVHAPDILPVEVSNAFWKSTRFRQWPASSARLAADEIMQIGLELHASSDLLGSALALAIDRGVTVYDSLYVVLAVELQAPLYTADERLVRKLSGSIPLVRSIAGR